MENCAGTNGSKQSSPHSKRSMDTNETDSATPKRQKIDEELYFLRLIGDAVEIFKKQTGVTDEVLDRSVEEVKRSFLFSEGRKFQDVDYKLPENLCAFFYRLSPASSGITRSKMRTALQECQELLAAFNQQRVNVVSVGGGSGCDIIGLYSALYEKTTEPRLINMTIVDNVKGWKSFFKLQEFLLLEGNYGYASSLIQNWSTSSSFVYEDASLPDGQQCFAFKNALSEADVVIVKSLFSILEYDEKVNVAKNVTQQLKEGALLVFIDSPSYPWQKSGLKKIYPLEAENGSPDLKRITVDDRYNFPGSPCKRYGSGISKSSKAQLSIFVKSIE